MSETGAIEEEEEETRGKTGRSAYFAGVHAADGFGGSYRGVKPAPHGGAATVKEEDTLGSATYCWCGQPFDHSWPGKDVGRKHPREESKMSSAAQHHTEERFDITELKTFDRRVARFVADLANDYGVRVRILDGSHAILYGLEGGKTLKVSASRGAEQTLAFLEKFAREQVAPHLVHHQAEALAEQFNDPTKKRRPRAVKKAAPAPVEAAVAPTPTPEPEAAPTPSAAAPVSTGRNEDRAVRDLNPDAVAPEGYEQHYSAGGVALNWWKKIGAKQWLCKSCDFTATGTLLGHGSHTGVHTMSSEQRAEHAASGAKSRDDQAAGKRTKARNAIRFLAEEYGIDIALDKKVKAGTKSVKEIEKLTAQLEKVTAERDDLKARLDLMREAMRA